MFCPFCQGPTRRFGYNRNGSQRYRCDRCVRTFTDHQTRPVDGRFVPNETIILCLRMLLEGNSLRSTERLTGVRRETIIDRLVKAGRKCQRFLEMVVQDVPVQDIQADEIWGFVFCKEKTRERSGRIPDGCGDAYCFTALERTTKMIVAWHLGKRCPADTRAFALKLHHATQGRFQLTTDGYRPYLTTIPAVFGANIDYATLVKVYGEPEEERRYSPPHVVEVVPTVRIGNPEESRICTSHVERSNLTIRMTIRRLTRLTNAFSKKWENHEAALALFFGYYNYCRVHMTLKTTPAVKAGLAIAPWSLQELLDAADSSMPTNNASPPAI
jgi:transposase-like protein/IS1 family transposase